MAHNLFSQSRSLLSFPFLPHFLFLSLCLIYLSWKSPLITVCNGELGKQEVTNVGQGSHLYFIHIPCQGTIYYSSHVRRCPFVDVLMAHNASVLMYCKKEGCLFILTTSLSVGVI